MRGVARFAGGTQGDPLSYLDDDFQGTSLDPKWLVYKPAALASAVVGSGYLEMQIVRGGNFPDGSFWFNDFNGTQIYQLVAGNFVMEMRVQLLNAAGSGPPPLVDFNVAGLQARNPSGAPLPTGFDYIHIGPATNTTADFNSECKSTAASVSTFDYVVTPSTSQWVQVTRIGQVFSTAYKLNAGDPWIPRTTYNRAVSLPPLPNVLAIGPMLYSNASPSDICGRFSYFTVRTP